jgi:O-antigen/teichoic acid export membrane protein
VTPVAVHDAPGQAAAAQASHARNAVLLARGTGLVIAGVGIARGFGMLGRVLVARGYSPHQFGLLALGLGVAAVAATVGQFGLSNGMARFVGHYRGRGDADGLKTVVVGGLATAAVLGAVCGLVLVLAAPWIAGVLNAPDLAPVLRLLGAMVPFAVLNVVMVSVFRGFDRAREYVLFEAVFGNAVKAAIIVAAFLAGAPFLWIIVAYVASAALESLALGIYARRWLAPVLAGGRVRARYTRELLVFSVPLLGNDFVRMAGAQATTVLLGVFLVPAQVGVFSASMLLVSIAGTVYASMRYLFLPVSSRLHASTQHQELRSLYATLTRWLTVVSFPVVAVLVVLAGPLLAWIYGPQYAAGAVALQILACAQFLGIWLGPNGMTLLAAGHSRALFWSGTVSSAAGILLMVLLVPTWGMTGAAVAAATGTAGANLLAGALLQRFARINPFARGFLPMSAALAAAAAAGWALARGGSFGIAPAAAAVLVFLAALAVTAGATLLFVGLHEADRVILHGLRRRIPFLARTAAPESP